LSPRSEEEHVRKKYLAAASAVLALLVVAVVAYANPVSDSSISLKISGVSPKNSGSKSTPKTEKFKLFVDGKTKSGTGQPETTKTFTVTTPSEWRYRGKSWPSSQRCDETKADTAKSDSVCPSKSKAGSGNANLLAGNASIKRKLTLRLHVVKNGGLGAWAQSQPGDVPAVAQFIRGSVSGHKIKFNIPTNLQMPLGVKSSIDNLTFTFKGHTKIKGHDTGLLRSVGCKTGKWKFKLVFGDIGGNLTDSDKSGCTP
jgi:hypothetical protein